MSTQRTLCSEPKQNQKLYAIVWDHTRQIHTSQLKDPKQETCKMWQSCISAFNQILEGSFYRKPHHNVSTSSKCKCLPWKDYLSVSLFFLSLIQSFTSISASWGSPFVFLQYLPSTLHSCGTIVSHGSRLLTTFIHPVSVSWQCNVVKTQFSCYITRWSSLLCLVVQKCTKRRPHSAGGKGEGISWK